MIACAAGWPAAQDVRQHTRLAGPRETAVSEAQAAALTLTVTAVSPRLIQTWVRTAGTIDKTGKVLGASLAGPDAALVKVGQRVRAFPPSSKSSMYQAYVTRVTPTSGAASTRSHACGVGRQNAAHYVMEIVVERGPFLSVPNEAIIEEGDVHIVYVQTQPGQYVPAEIQTGIQGELLHAGPRRREGRGDQVVTFGSFFIDAEHKLKGTGRRRNDHRDSLDSSSAGRPSSWVLVAAGVLVSVYSIRIASLDAIPDISDPQIVVYVKWPRSPQLLEREVTEPLISALVGSPDIQSIRGIVAHGLLVHLRDPRQRRAAGRGAADGARPDQRHPAAAPAGRERHARAQRQQHGLDLSVRARRSRRAPTTCASCAWSTRARSSPRCRPSPASPRWRRSAGWKSSTRSRSFRRCWPRPAFRSGR